MRIVLFATKWSPVCRCGLLTPPSLFGRESKGGWFSGQEVPEAKGWTPPGESPGKALPFTSWTARLLAKGPEFIAKKVTPRGGRTRDPGGGGVGWFLPGIF